MPNQGHKWWWERDSLVRNASTKLESASNVSVSSATKHSLASQLETQVNTCHVACPPQCPQPLTTPRWGVLPPKHHLRPRLRMAWSHHHNTRPTLCMSSNQDHRYANRNGHTPWVQSPTAFRTTCLCGMCCNQPTITHMHKTHDQPQRDASPTRCSTPMHARKPSNKVTTVPWPAHWSTCNCGLQHNKFTRHATNT